MKYFVEELPRGCFYCDCCHTKDYDCRYKIDGEKFCGIVNFEVGRKFYDFENPCRPDWCPLKFLLDINDDNYLITGVEDGWIKVDKKVWQEYLKAKESCK